MDIRQKIPGVLFERFRIFWIFFEILKIFGSFW